MRALRDGGCDVLTVLEAGNVGLSDPDQLAFAETQGRVTYTANQRDFALLHHRLLRTGRSHAGIVVCTWQGMPPEEQARRLIRLANETLPEAMINRLEYLGRA